MRKESPPDSQEATAGITAIGARQEARTSISHRAHDTQALAIRGHNNKRTVAGADPAVLGSIVGSLRSFDLYQYFTARRLLPLLLGLVCRSFPLFLPSFFLARFLGKRDSTPASSLRLRLLLSVLSLVFSRNHFLLSCAPFLLTSRVHNHTYRSNNCPAQVIGSEELLFGPKNKESAPPALQGWTMIPSLAPLGPRYLQKTPLLSSSNLSSKRKDGSVQERMTRREDNLQQTLTRADDTWTGLHHPLLLINMLAKL